MKKIHKKVIALQARALDKALKQISFKKSRADAARGPGYNKEYKSIISVNNTTFSHGIEKIKSSSVGTKARAVRQLFYNDFEHYKNSGCLFRIKSGRSWNIRDHAFTYVFKANILFTAIGFKNTSSYTHRQLLKMIHKWLKDGRTTKFTPERPRWDIIKQKPHSGIHPDETIAISSKDD